MCDIVIGLDLSGSSSRPTGIAKIMPPLVKFTTLYSNEDIVSVIAKTLPKLVAIDAPLTLPRKGYMRCIDRMMHKLGFPVLPPLFPGMRSLTRRGIILKSWLEEAGIEFIEVHPRSSLKALERLWSRKLNLEDIASKFSLEITIKPKSKHELDAFLAAITALLHLQGKTKVISCPDGSIVIPRWYL